MNLDPAALGIVRAIFGMGLLTFAMFFWMSFARLASMKRAGLTLVDAEYTEDLRPRLKGAGRKVGDNYNHLFEAPVVFYAVALAILFAHAADPMFAVAAWAFLAFRIVHSLVQATINIVQVRMGPYLCSWAALGFMIVRGALKVYGLI